MLDYFIIAFIVINAPIVIIGMIWLFMQSISAIGSIIQLFVTLNIIVFYAVATVVFKIMAHIPIFIIATIWLIFQYIQVVLKMTKTICTSISNCWSRDEL